MTTSLDAVVTNKIAMNPTKIWAVRTNGTDKDLTKIPKFIWNVPMQPLRKDENADGYLASFIAGDEKNRHKYITYLLKGEPGLCICYGASQELAIIFDTFTEAAELYIKLRNK